LYEQLIQDLQKSWEHIEYFQCVYWSEEKDKILSYSTQVWYDTSMKIKYSLQTKESIILMAVYLSMFCWYVSILRTSVVKYMQKNLM